jgi:hypothetical protein
MVVIEVRKGEDPKGNDVGFWGQIGPNDEDDDLPLAWLSEYAAKPDAANEATDEA